MEFGKDNLHSKMVEQLGENCEERKLNEVKACSPRLHHIVQLYVMLKILQKYDIGTQCIVSERKYSNPTLAQN